MVQKRLRGDNRRVCLIQHGRCSCERFLRLLLVKEAAYLLPVRMMLLDNGFIGSSVVLKNRQLIGRYSFAPVSISQSVLSLPWRLY